MNNEAVQIWQKALLKLKLKLTSTSFNTWIEPLTAHDTENGQLLLIAPDSTSKTMLNSRHIKTISDVIKECGHSNGEVKILLSSDINKSTSGITTSTLNASFYGSNLKSRYIFETFVKGKSNELAFAASVAVAESPGKTTYNPLFLYGGVGLGKTHLMHSIGNYILHCDPEAKVLYTSTENLTNDFINSIREHKNQEFRDKYRTIDVLLVDDIQFLSGKNETQEEFFHTFNALYFANKQIVISSDKPPIELKTLEERLTSRFGSGLIVDITLPDFETRTAILEKKAELDHMDVPNDVIRAIAKNVSSNIRELEGALTRVTAYAKLTNAVITIEMAEKALKDMFNENGKRELSVEYIQEVVSEYYNITVEEMRSKRRKADFTFARHIAMYLSHMLIDLPLIKIGQNFGGRDHATVIHACNKIADELEANAELRSELNIIEKKLRSE